MQNLCESLLNRWYNTKFNLTQYVYDIDKQLRQQDKIIHILNETISNDADIEQRIEKVKQTCSKIIWFSYRKNIPKFQVSSLTSDTGWGCMIRVAQMALAQIIRYYNYFKKPEQLIVLIRHFIDDDDNELTDFIQQFHKNQNQYYHAPFSIQKIVHYAKVELKKEPGDWYKSDEILQTLDYLFKYSQYSLNMEIYINYDCAFILQDAIQQMFNQQEGNEIWLKERAKNNNQFDLQDHKGICIFLPTRIGLQNINKDYLEVLNQIIALPYFQGMIGGVSKRALYFVGRIQDYLIYLDPHFVQNAQNFDDLSKNQASYTCQNIQLIHNSLIDPSIVVCLCIRNALELLDLWQIFQHFKQEYQDLFFFSLLETKAEIEKSFEQIFGDDNEFINIAK
ncbi:unnamed protein product (macronuclear) [Paramecium tetraurelia]|uniref:Cysteine protease n=1 Tax=Paramecium tetraurelia TaxID=5888 RepID=A0CSC7_PARTE|nr:uncharacterized protein GSPATT00009966001 [Paramecium tetraurelia]CAK73694.1 unnamed protein product [Paramecium tetraurelia]|eukprot:XP_001441091.1 hypothetical protein (macronuclear) [Paramecium tetraurelia strain d4-2]